MAVKLNPFTGRLQLGDSGGGGGGNVIGPGSSTDNALVRWDGITGTAIKNGIAVETDAGEVLVGNGSTSNPSLSFVSDATSGFHTDGAGNTNYAAGGTDTILLTSAFSRFLQPLQFYNEAVFWDGLQLPNVVLQTTGTYVATIHDLMLLANTNNAITFQLPSAPAQGQTYYIKDATGTGASTNNITVNAGGSTTIDGVTSYVIKTTRGGIVVTYNSTVGGYLVLSNSGLSAITRQVFTTTQAYTPTVGTKYCDVEMVGGGGGGGGAAASATGSSAGGAGGAGAYFRKLYPVATIAGLTVTIGTAGAGGTAGANIGTGGGGTALGALVQANGGNGGSGGSNAAATGVLVNAAGGLGGTTSGGDINAPGAPGGSSNAFLTVGSFGVGGSSFYGGGARSPAINSIGQGVAGVNAVLYGSGGSGGIDLGSNTARAGGNGSAGIVVITEYA